MSQTEGGKRWWLVGVFVPLIAALIGVAAVLLGKDPPPPPPPSSTSPTVEAFPSADPIPADWCFQCNADLVPLAKECRDGSMNACDDLWKSNLNLTDEGDRVIYEYALLCGGRRPPHPSGYRYKDCIDEFPGHP
jgi:hypothetical protein